MNSELNRLNPGSEVITIVKSALWIGLAGLLAGIALTVWWGLSASGDVVSFGIFAVLVIPMLGSILGTLGGGGAVATARMFSGRPHVRLYTGIAFGAIATAFMLLMQSQTLSLGTVAATFGIGALLALFGYLYVAPRLLVRG